MSAELDDTVALAPPPARPVLEAVGVVKSFPGVRALRGVSLSIEAGSVHALVGENGAGKSTLIKVLTGVYAPDEGEVRVEGQPVSFARPLDSQRAGIQTIYQEVNLVPQMSVARNLFLGREPRTSLRLLDFTTMHAEADRALRSLGVVLDVRRPLGELGVGTRQMVALARAVSEQAKVVVMDEPTSALEPREVETLFEVIEQLRSQGIGVLYVSHRLDELYRLCDTVTVLRDGDLVHAGPMSGLERVRLISLMIGRDMTTVRQEGVTAFREQQAAAGSALLSVRGLSRRHVLDDVGFDVRPGQILGLGGLLGAGRSETLRAVAGALPTDAGSVTVADGDVPRGSITKAIRAGIAFLSEDRKVDGIVPGLSVRDNIVLSALPRLSRAGLVDDARLDTLADTFIDRLRIKVSSRDQRVSDLSGGNQQKVLLARLLCLEPRVLLLDEPTRGIDVGAKAEVQSLVDELAAQGLSVVLVSSDIEELVEGAERIVVLRDGRVSGELSGEDVTVDGLLHALASEDHEEQTDG